MSNPPVRVTRAVVCRGRIRLTGLLAAVAAVCIQAEAALDKPIVVTQVPLQARPAAAGDPDALLRTDVFDGARLVQVWPNGEVRVLSHGFHSACDPDISFDGERLLFAGRKTSESRWRVWEMRLDGQGLRAVSPEHLDARRPIYVSTLFTLDSPEPWFTTIFVGWEITPDEPGARASSSLFNIRLDGGELRRLTFTPYHNIDPFQMWDGRVLYAGECHPNAPGDREAHVGLFAIHLEGADMELYGGESGGRIQHMPCATERGLVVFVEAEPGTRDGAGQLACLDERRPHVTYRRLTQDPARLFLYPSPWTENRVLVSDRPASGGDGGISLIDLDRGQSERVYDSAEYDDLQAVVVRARKQPDGHSTVVNPKFNTGTFYALNCYTSDPMREDHLRPGAIKRVRFIEGVVQPAGTASRAGCQPLSVPRRLIGEAPVEADGSFNVEVPADTPLLLQTLDERGLALGTCGWIWVKPRETRGCIGCHEDPERIPENEYVLALRRPSNQLVLQPEQRRTVSFRETIAPILKTHCATAACHGGADTPLCLPLTGEPPSPCDVQAAYAALMVGGGATSGAPGPVAGKYVEAGRARTSWLIWQLMGTNTTRPWDRNFPSSLGRPVKIKPMPPPGQGGPLPDTARRTIVQWVDLGAPYEVSTAPATPVSAEDK